LVDAPVSLPRIASDALQPFLQLASPGHRGRRHEGLAKRGNTPPALPDGHDSRVQAATDVAQRSLQCGKNQLLRPGK